ncbi:MAG: mannose-1-phosphate guanyltransferase [Alphaproteobacteria bacterium]|nr:mannose-1-phosphate guanyltransferase [Alphaproteobacteria bacterium]
MAQTRILPAIMSGGSGTRLWPTSTDDRPKQFHALGGARTLIQDTIARVQMDAAGLSFAAPMILCNARHGALVEAQLAAIGATASAIALEPVGRNTAATAAIAAQLALEIDPEALVLLLPADHVIADADAFLDVAARAAPIARERIVTFGIAPSRPETGYGYIKHGAPLTEGVFAIEAFKEKPQRDVAQRYLDDGGYSWNAGMFLFSPRVLLQEFAGAADIRDAALAALAAAPRDGVRIALPDALFAQAPSEPLDIAVMEKTRLGAVAPCDIGWADVGSWAEIWRLAPQDGKGNAVSGDVIAHDASGLLVRNDSGLKIALAGVSDLIVIATDEAVMIVSRERAQDVKKLWELARK